MENKPRLSWRELLCAALPFLLYLAIPLVSFIQAYWAALVIFLLIGALVILAIIGLAQGMPRWSLPVLGLSLAIINVPLLSLVDPNFNPFASLPRWLGQLLGPSLSSVGILALTLMVVCASAAFGPWRPFFQRLRQDYTLLPFALFGAMPIFKLLSFDEYEGDVPYAVGMGLMLMGGLWAYLKSARSSRRLLALGTAITLATVIEAVGKWILVPSQHWPMWFQWHTIGEAQQIEVTSVAANWLWSMLIVFLPALLGLFPRPARFEASAHT